VLAVFTPPSGLDASTYPVYSGFIDVTSGSETVHVSYLGLLGSLKDKQVIDTTDAVLGFKVPAILNATQHPQVDPTNYTFVGKDHPSFVFRFVLPFPTPRLLRFFKKKCLPIEIKSFFFFFEWSDWSSELRLYVSIWFKLRLPQAVSPAACLQGPTFSVPSSQLTIFRVTTR